MPSITFTGTIPGIGMILLCGAACLHGIWALDIILFTGATHRWLFPGHGVLPGEDGIGHGAIITARGTLMATMATALIIVEDIGEDMDMEKI
jgi:hypothetical protein